MSASAMLTRDSTLVCSAVNTINPDSVFTSNNLGTHDTNSAATSSGWDLTICSNRFGKAIFYPNLILSIPTSLL